jgi:hypothetical protein
MRFTRQARVVLVLLSAVSTIAKAQFSTATASVAQETQAASYWVDPATGLMWAGQDNGKKVSWHAATRYCRKLRLAGYSDWRLGTIAELEGLFDNTWTAPPGKGTDYVYFPGAKPIRGVTVTGSGIWSSSPEIESRGRPVGDKYWFYFYMHGWRAVGFEDLMEGDTEHALCVRDSGQPPSASSGKETVAQSATGPQSPAQEAQAPAYSIDPSTGLMWAAKDNGKDVHLGEALKYCRDLRAAGYSDWRLPAIDELQGPRGSNVGGVELFLTGDPWSSSPVSEDGEPSVFVWYFSLSFGTRVFDEASYSHNRRALCVRGSMAHYVAAAGASCAGAAPLPGKESAQETQLRGYWIDPATGLMWSGMDSFRSFMLYSDEATKYCHDLRLGRYSDWRLATIEELQGIYDRTAEAPGENPRSYNQEPEPLFFHVKGNLFLTGMEWGRTSKMADGNPSEDTLVADFRTGTLIDDKHDSIRGKRALCVRRSSE